ncbi:ankyrin repeat domain-containing protein [Leifsonia sp. NPDC058230]|uniref:ankyrin repeat domain-containing protein n=1 Tax=Leifsonia sp. NPDC058230 TaxID=3346391 RepID=UPI0036DD4ED9
MNDSVPDPKRTALHAAAVEGGADDVHAALSSGDAIDAQDSQGNTPLFLAAVNQNLETLTALLDAGADMELANLWGNTPLWAATFYSADDGALIQALLDRGADAHHVNKAGNSPRKLAWTIANYDVRRFYPRG